MRAFLIALISVACIGCWKQGDTNPQLVLAAREKQADWQIAIDAESTPVQRFAASELQTYLRRITGIELPIVEGSGTNAGPRTVFIRQLQDAADDGFDIRAEHGGVAISGGQRGVLYGVYDLLERFGGVRWYSSWCEKVPHLSAFSVPADIHVRQKPAFRYRMTTWHDALSGGVDRSWNFAARCRLNGIGELKESQGGCVYRFGGGLGNCHTFASLLPTAEYGEAHPEYYALVNGERKCRPGTDQSTQPCLTNPDVLRIVTANVLERIRQDPSAGYYGVSQNDNQNYCRCAKCQRVDREEGSHSGTVIRFVNAVAEAVEREFPQAVIETLAYRYSRKPPLKSRPRDNVMVVLCTIECDFSRPIPDSDCMENRRIQEDIAGWGGMAKRLCVWDYTVNFRHYLNQFPNFDALEGNVRFFRDSGVTDLFEQGNGQGGCGYFAEWKTYLLSRLMWNPGIDVAVLEEDFFNGFYGKAGPFVLKYYREMLCRGRLAAEKGGHYLGIYEKVMEAPYDAEFYEWADGVWQQAAKAVEDGPEVQRENVWRSSLFIDYARVMADCQTVHLDGRGLASSPEKLVASARKLLSAMEKDSTIRFSENGGNNVQLTDILRKVAEGRIPRPSAPGRIEESRLILSRSPGRAEYVDDSLAEDGKAIRYFNTHHDWTSSLQMGDVDFVPGRKYRIRVRVRVEKDYAAQEGAAFWSGVYDMASGRELLHIEPTIGSVDDGVYAWYNLGVFRPAREQYFWIGPPPFGKDGRSPVRAVFLDAVEFVAYEAKLSGDTSLLRH